jgi:hypothetical protein
MKYYISVLDEIKKQRRLDHVIWIMQVDHVICGYISMYIHAVSNSVKLCYVTLRYFTLRCIMLCYVMLCYVMLCYVMLCYVMLQLCLRNYFHNTNFIFKFELYLASGPTPSPQWNILDAHLRPILAVN